MSRFPSLVRRLGLNRLLSAALLHVALLAGAAAHELHQEIFSFAVPPAGPMGELTQLPDGSFYGTTSAGGANAAGTVFKLGPDGAFKTVVEFTGYTGAQRGAQPAGKLVLGSDGNYYGVNAQGGILGFGNIFKILPNGTSLPVVNFTSAGTNFRGALPYASLLPGGDGFLYGTTSRGGAYNLGTVFKVAESNGAFTTLFEFGGKRTGAKGANPYAALIKGPDGLLYGTTAKGGAKDYGTVFSISTTGTLKTLVEFTDLGPKNKGNAPYGPLTLAVDGKLWGTTARGGKGDYGTIFKMTTAGALTTVVELTGRAGTNRGAQPEAALIVGPNDELYSTTLSGGRENVGTVFKVTPAGKLATLVDFSIGTVKNIGGQPQGGLTLAADGKFYGATLRGGANHAGTIFKMSATGELATLLQLSGVAPGVWAQGAIIRGRDTNFYGVSSSNGLLGRGSVYRITQAGVNKTIAEFTGTGGPNRGSTPRAPLLEGQDGFFYGSTYDGGANDLGTIFKISSAGVLTTLVEFTGNGATNHGAAPRAALIQLEDGNFYGVTTKGGAKDAGTVFRLTPSGMLTTLVEFTDNGTLNKGVAPEAALLLGSDGNLHGTTSRGGAKGLGTIFSMNPAGVLTTQVEFADDPTGIKGAIPEAPLIEGADGRFYGTTATGGATGDGTVFALTPSGALTTLVEFTGKGGKAKGTGPTSPLVAAIDGYLYGTTAFGGKQNYGTAYRITSSGAFATVAELAYQDGAYPENGFELGTDGNLYTTSSLGGASGAGAIIKLRLRTETELAEGFATTPTATTLRANLSLGELSSRFYFQYGISEYDQQTSVQQVPSGDDDYVVSASLTGLLPNTVYYFRTVVIDSSGTVYGHDESFTTPPAATTVLASGVALAEEPTTTIIGFGVPAIADNRSVAVVATLKTSSGLQTALLAGVTPTIVARQGGTAPAPAPGQAADFTSFQDPVSDATGKVAFLGKIKLGDGKAATALYTDLGGALVQVARVGGDAPKVEGAKLSALSSYAMSHLGVVFYVGTLTGKGITASNNSALWAFDEAGQHLLLRKGDLAAGLPITSFVALSPVAGSLGQGRGYFDHLATARVTLSNGSQAVVQVTPDEPMLVIGPTPFHLMGAGMEMGMGMRSVIGGLGAPSISTGGATAFLATLENKKAAVLADTSDESLLVVAEVGTPAPAVDLATFATLSDPVYNAQLDSAFAATLAGTGITAKNRSTLWWNSANGLSLLARVGEAVPTLPGALWSSFVSLALPDNSGPLFLAKLGADDSREGLPSDVKASNNLGLFVIDGSRARRLLIRTGDAVPVNGEQKTISLLTVLTAVPGSSGQGRSYNASGDVVVRATFTDHTQAILRVALPLATNF